MPLVAKDENKNRFIHSTDAGVCGAEMIGRVCVFSFLWQSWSLEIKTSRGIMQEKSAIASYAFCLKINTQIKACSPPTRRYSARRHVQRPACPDNNLCTLCKTAHKNDFWSSSNSSRAEREPTTTRASIFLCEGEFNSNQQRVKSSAIYLSSTVNFDVMQKRGRKSHLESFFCTQSARSFVPMMIEREAW